MSTLVDTAQGTFDLADLHVVDVTCVNDTSRAIATEYRLNGALVRRDVAVSLFRAPGAGTEQGSL